MTRILDLCSLLWALSAACATASPCFAENWPGFRGPTGQGVSHEKNLPLTWSLHENLSWRAQIPGIAWSSPSVWEDRVVVTSASPDGTSCRLLCLDAASGKIIWDKELFHQATPRKLAENSHATPTPVTDGNLVYAAFNGGRVMAVDFQGNIAWDWQDKEFVSKHGLAVSPILYRDKLIMPFDGNGPADPVNIGFRTAWDGAFIVALDKHTGQEKWRAKRGLSRAGACDADGHRGQRPSRNWSAVPATSCRGSIPTAGSASGRCAAWAKVWCRRSSMGRG